MAQWKRITWHQPPDNTPVWYCNKFTGEVGIARLVHARGDRYYIYPSTGEFHSVKGLVMADWNAHNSRMIEITHWKELDRMPYSTLKPEEQRILNGIGDLLKTALTLLFLLSLFYVFFGIIAC